MVVWIPDNSEIEHIKQDAVSELDSSVPFREKDLIVGPDAGFNVQQISSYFILLLPPSYQCIWHDFLIGMSTKKGDTFLCMGIIWF